MNINVSKPHQTPLNTYIGARYVPVYEGNYDPDRAYEGLSIVTVPVPAGEVEPLAIVQNMENSYMSVQPVPPNSTKPWEDTNHVYWIHLYASSSEEPTPSFADSVIHTPESLGMVKTTEGYYDLGNTENATILNNLTTGILFLYDWIYLNSTARCQITVPVFIITGPRSFTSETVPVITFINKVYTTENSVPVEFIQKMPYKTKWYSSEIFAFNINDINKLPANTDLYLDITYHTQMTLIDNIVLKNNIKLHGVNQTVTINGPYSIENATFVENLTFTKSNNTTGIGVFYYGTNSGSTEPKIIKFNKVSVISAPLMTVESLIINTVKIKDCQINGTVDNSGAGYIQLVDNGATIENLNLFNVDTRFYTICGTAQINRIRNVLANKMYEHATSTNFMHNFPKGIYLNTQIVAGDITVGKYGCTFIHCELRSNDLTFNAASLTETTVTLIDCITTTNTFPNWVVQITPTSTCQLGFAVTTTRPTQHISDMMFYGTLSNNNPFALYIYLYDPITSEIKVFLENTLSGYPYVNNIKLAWIRDNSSKAEISFTSTYNNDMKAFLITTTNINRPNDAKFFELRVKLNNFKSTNEISLIRQLP